MFSIRVTEADGDLLCLDLHYGTNGMRTTSNSVKARKAHVIDYASNVAHGVRSEVVIPQASEKIVGTSTAVPLTSGIAVGILSVLPLEETLLPSEDIRRSGKRKTVADYEGEAAMPRKGTEGDGGSGDSRKMKRDREAPS
ncbi:Peptidase S8 [Forsythia ovata]|uniref:Peptidase S8 n=1 Tax=Forsythia ovata TaxID=205694 RepID=A0ABD1WR50_9LAMI